LIGQTLSHYKILEKIGAGGMGEVYRAHDSKLGRDVALKVLPEAMASDLDRRKRFEREARVVAALKHPNIVTIHSVEEADTPTGTVHFITMEFVEGQTLSALIPKDGLPIERFLELSVAIADAVSSAHDKGVTHRDLKPANVMLDADGRIKVLDFGLAKLLHPDAAGENDETVGVDSVTAEGAIVGTIAYMSPEQAQGQNVDHRSDIFSLGVILYEMATGRQPFTGDTKISKISSILRDEPATVSDVKHTLPRHLGRIIKRSLAKDPKRRYQSALDLRNDLEGLKEEFESDVTMVTGESSAITVVPRRPRWLVPVVGLAAVAIVALLVTAFMLSTDRGGGGAAPIATGAVEMVPITTNGNSWEATISADGRYVCYQRRDEKDRQSLWVTQVSTGSAVEIVPAKDGVFMWDPVFSPDGEFVYYVQNEEGSGNPTTLYRIPVLGGAPHAVKSDVGGRISFSPDRSRFVFARWSPANKAEIILVNADGSGEQVIGTRQFPKFYSNDPVWSPDGKTIAVAVGDLTHGILNGIAAIPADGGDERVFATDPLWTDVGELSWQPDGNSLLAEIEHSHITNHIWAVAFPGGEATRITGDLNTYHGVEITADGKTLVTQQMQKTYDMFVLPADGSSPPQRLTRVGKGTAGGSIDWLPDGRIVYDADAGGNYDIWIMQADGTDPHRLTVEPGGEGNPVVSPDGTRVVFISDRQGALDLFTMNIDGSNVGPLTDSGFAVDPAWTADGKWIVYLGYGEEPGQTAIYKMPAEGGDAIRLREINAGQPRVSPDGKRLLHDAFYQEERKEKKDIISLETGEVEWSQYIEGAQEHEWSPDGTAIVYSKHTEGVDNLWRHPLDGGEPELITDFTEREGIIAFRFSRDGNQIALSKGITTSDIVLLKNFR